MLKPTPIRILIGLCGGALLILVAAWSSGLVGEICNETKTGQQHCDTYNLAPLLIIKAFEGLHALDTVITALATVAIAWFTWTLWRATTGTLAATQESIKLSREEFNATHRPKIKVHAAEVKRFAPEVMREEGDDWPRIGADLVCFNVGESAALRVEVRGQILAGAGFAIDVQRPLVKNIGEVLSGQKSRANIRSEIPMVDVATGKRMGTDYHCVGWIAYWDQNGLRRETGFCFRADLWDKQRERWVTAEKPEYEYDY